MLFIADPTCPGGFLNLHSACYAMPHRNPETGELYLVEVWFPGAQKREFWNALAEPVWGMIAPAIVPVLVREAVGELAKAAVNPAPPAALEMPSI